MGQAFGVNPLASAYSTVDKGLSLTLLSLYLAVRYRRGGKSTEVALQWAFQGQVRTTTTQAGNSR